MRKTTKDILRESVLIKCCHNCKWEFANKYNTMCGYCKHLNYPEWEVEREFKVVSYKYKFARNEDR